MKWEIDTRGLAPPEPFERVVDALTEFQPGIDELTVLLAREPRPLLRMLSKNGYRFVSTRDRDGSVRVVIS